ncbi:hypothetical protein F0L74_13235 [Chitinophaga agrisoli]|uniref:Uncharacterized protein n=1 Tax=Chitinophaga agrisoli TaxID=2607653 RepID=A0A5B2VUG5_9BACT|nr:hypothetical protein [Chitinophaga agrisoli]KAA2243453.1 hypothetical protein F0L74_13235 [Chitinophaga agrisoli]
MNRYWFLFFCLSVWACNETAEGKKAAIAGDSIIIATGQIDSITREADTTKEQSGANSAMECDQALNLMFQTSSYQPDSGLHLSDYRIHVSEPGDSALGIRIYNADDHDSALIGILNLDLQTGELVDLSPNLDSEVVLTYDSSYLKIIRRQCGQLPPGLY